MSPSHSFNFVSVVLELDRDEMRRRGRLGAAARAMRTRLAKMSAEEQRAYFSNLGKRSHAARCARAAAAGEGGAV